MTIQVEPVGQVTDELVEACRRLLPQLSGSAAPPAAGDLARIAGHQANTLLVARDRGAIVGMLTLVMFPLPSGLRARIEDVVVDQHARGRGVGTALTMAAIGLAQRQGARSVDLTSRASRVAANRLYRRLGFELRDSHVYRYQPRPGWVSPEDQVRPARKGATMTSDPDHVRDEEIVTEQAEAALSGPGDTGVMMDAADSGTLDQSDVPTPSGASDTGVMMDAADSDVLDQSDVPTPSGASDTGAMMDSRDTGTLDRTDVGEGADADESDR